MAQCFVTIPSYFVQPSISVTHTCLPRYNQKHVCIIAYRGLICCSRGARGRHIVVVALTKGESSLLGWEQPLIYISLEPTPTVEMNFGVYRPRWFSKIRDANLTEQNVFSITTMSVKA